nr:pentatricopeptide repeat protein AaPPR1373 [Agave angustifolia]
MVWFRITGGQSLTQVKPNHVTFIGVLSACAHSGLVSEGRRFWLTMQELGIEPMMEHYWCMVDLQCRAGCFKEARSFVNSMPIFPNSIIWRTLLVGCKNSKSFDKGEIIAGRLLELEPLNAENYVLLSNLYASNSQWEKVSYMRKQMKDSGVKIVPGLSSIEIVGYVHELAVDDESHAESKEIREVLKDISERVLLSIVRTNSLTSVRFGDDLVYITVWVTPPNTLTFWDGSPSLTA